MNSEKKNDGGPVYPVPTVTGGFPNGDFIYKNAGMTLLGHFSGLAMSAMLKHQYMTLAGMSKNAFPSEEAKELARDAVAMGQMMVDTLAEHDEQ